MSSKKKNNRIKHGFYNSKKESGNNELMVNISEKEFDQPF